ncbi:hypothetical protein ACIRBX_20310 [Kitasatospora sp. NPDC096147]|uniref:hypothetical protein n=1 Tax=Kitasatospora sp. NPDC096147 TaxID=3364093 RepID=UPI00380191F1
MTSATESKLAHGWLGSADLKTIAEQVGTPVFVYSEAQLLRNVDRIMRAAEAAGLRDRVDLYVPFFPNSNPHVLRPFQRLGVGLLVQLPGEYRLLKQFGFERFIVSPGHVSDEEMTYWAQTGHPTFLSSLDEVRFSLEAGAPSISARIDSLDSGKPGIKLRELDQLSALLAEHGRELDCFEVYCGSGNSREAMTEIIETLFSIFNEHFPQTRSINFAGGHGFVYEAWAEDEKHFDWGQYLGDLRAIADRMGIPEHVRFMFEPARDVLADTGALLLGVERSVITNPVSNIVVTDGTRMLMPSAQLRERHHHVVFLDEELREIPTDGQTGGCTAALRGRTILRHDYVLPGEVWVPDGVDGSSHLLILDVGAYCATQHMEFLNVPPAAEVLVDTDGVPHLITDRGPEDDKWRHVLAEMQELKG